MAMSPYETLEFPHSRLPLHVEREQFLAVRTHLPLSLRPVVTFAYLTGWRVPSEVLTLQWRQVDLDAGTVRLDANTTKNDDGRLFPFGNRLPELRELLEAQRDETKRVEREQGIICPWLFHRSGKPIKSLDGAWRKAGRLAGCPGRLMHDFRRTAVRNLVRAGIPEKTAMLLTGHKTRSVFDRYDIVNENDLREAVGRLAALAGTVSGTAKKRRRERGPKTA